MVSSSLPESLSSSSCARSFSIFSASRRSSRSLTARAASLITTLPPAFSSAAAAAATASSTSATPASLSRVEHVTTYRGDATRLTAILMPPSSGFPLFASAARIASLMCITPSYAKHVNSTSARTFSGCGVMRRRMSFTSASFTAASTAGEPSGRRNASRIASGSDTMRLNASKQWPCVLYSGQAMCSYSSCSVFPGVVSATCRKMECTILLLLYFSSAAATSSGLTRRFERSMYPFSLSTRSTITGSTRPTLMSLLTERMRRRVSSESRIIPSMPLYSRSCTYAPISAIDLTCTITTSSTSGNGGSYMRQSPGACDRKTEETGIVVSRPREKTHRRDRSRGTSRRRDARA